MILTQIEATTIGDAWFQCISKVLDIGNKYIIEQGSFVGQTRLEFDYCTIQISHPYQEPYDLMLPDIPDHYNIPSPVEKGYIEQYLPYLMTGHKEPDEDYTYGERINAVHLMKQVKEANTLDLIFVDHIVLNQVDHFIELLTNTPNTNQAILQVAQPQDCLLNDPPCLRHIDMRVQNNKLIFYPYFRSWDLWGGFPANLAGIAVLQKYMADSIGIESGAMIASSKGLHLYGYVENLAKLRTNK